MTSDEKALIALLVAAFLLSKADIAAMTALIITGRTDSAKASYQQSSDTVGASTDWEPDSDLQGDIKDSSEQDAESIASTYKSELEAVATAFVAGWMSNHDSLDGCEGAARTELATWATTRAAWKSEQIANYTCGAGANAGIDQWILDLIDEDIELPDGVTLDDIEVEIQPDEAVCDACKEIAGKRFDFDEADDIELPSHSNCPHRKVIVMKGG
jgi:hypothetical protein